ncbi:MAG: nickel-responsive transcriptional regulator NikR [Lentisphaerota bacterium]
MLERFSISLDQDLLLDFDRHLKQKKYPNRSEAIRDLIREALVQQAWDANENVVGVISLVYNHHQRQLQDRITDAQHNHHDLVVSTTHIHLDHDDCLEVIIARGKSGKVRSLAESLIALRGVKSGKLQTTSGGEHIH